MGNIIRVDVFVLHQLEKTANGFLKDGKWKYLAIRKQTFRGISCFFARPMLS